jgi:hypothetical protein
MGALNYDQLLEAFADNTAQDISAGDCRNLIDSLFRAGAVAYALAAQVIDPWDSERGTTLPEVIALESATLLGDWKLLDNSLYLDAADIGSKGDYLSLLSVLLTQTTGGGDENVLRLQGFSDSAGWETVWESPKFDIPQSKPRSYAASFLVTVSPADGHRKFRWQLDSTYIYYQLQPITFENLQWALIRIGA